MIYRILRTIILLLICFQFVGAQNEPLCKDIKGVVCEYQDTADIVLEYATVRLLNSKDSTIIKSMSTGRNGEFLFSMVEPDDYLLSISFLGYISFFEKIEKNQFSAVSVNLGKIFLEENSVLLSEVVISGEIPEVVVKEDTLEYNPAAFKMQDGAVAEDLLKRLPGVEVDADGKITVVGKPVKRVLVDGKEFFRDDPKMATKNITLDVVDKVQVIDKKSDMELLTGVADGEEETIINLTIKKGMKKGWMANATAGAGAFIDNPVDNSARYSANTMINRFLEEDMVTLILNSNNINNQGSTDGGNSVRSSMRSRGGGGSGGSGITNSTSAGINAVGIINDKWKAGGDIRYNYSDEYILRKGFRQNILADSVSYRESLSNDQNYSNNWGLDTKIEFTPDSFNTVVLSAKLSYNKSNSQDYFYQSTLAGDKDSTRVNASEADTYINSDGWVAGLELTYSRRFSKKGRRFNVTGSMDWNYSSGDGTNISLSEFFLQPDKDKSLNQELFNNSNSDSYGMRISYVEPVWNVNNTLQFSYNIRYNRRDNVRETYDYDVGTETYSILNPDYSKSLKNNFVNQNLGMSFNAVHTNYSYNIGINVVPSYTQSTSYIKEGDVDGNDSILNRIDGRNVINYSPQLSFTYRFNKQANMRFSYRGNTRQPSVNQLDPTPNNTNPLNIRTGNPDLLPSFSHNLSLRYNNSQRESQRSLTGNLSFAFTQNEIINFTSYEDETGIQHTKPINENGSWNTSLNVMYNLPLDKKKKFKFSTQSLLGYDSRIGFINVNKQSERNISGTLEVEERIGLSYSKDWFYGQLRGNVKYSTTSNTMEGREDQQSTNFGATYNTQIFLPNSWTLGLDINYRANRGLSVGYNTNEVLWNAEISKQFLSKKQAGLRLRWNDILQQTLNIRRSINASYIEDNEYNTLTSYFLVSFSYRFNQMGGKKRDNSSRSNGRDFQRGQEQGGERRNNRF